MYKIVMKDSFLKLMFSILKNYMTFAMIYFFLPERMKIGKVENLVSNFRQEKEYAIHMKFYKSILNRRVALKKCRELLNLIKKLG